MAVFYLLAAAIDSNQWVTRSDASSASAVFNARGDMTSFTDGRGKTTSFIYDITGAGDGSGKTAQRAARKGETSGSERINRYEGNLTSRTDPLAHVSGWTYDSNGSPATKTDRNNKTTTIVFNNIGKLQSVATPNTGTVAFGYDLADKQTTTSDGLILRGIINSEFRMSESFL